MSGKPEAHSSEWGTPRWLFKELDAEFHFMFDAACTELNEKVGGGPVLGTNYRHEQGWDGLSEDWQGQAEGASVFLNPPYDRSIKRWVRKALLESLKGATVVCVLPVRTSTRWWHEYVLRANEIRFLPKRVRFEYKGKPQGSPREDTAIVIFRGLEQPFEVKDGPEK